MRAYCLALLVVTYLPHMEGLYHESATDAQSPCRWYLIIGPTPFTVPMSEAFVSALKDSGVEDADQRVVCSLIPIRA